MKRDISYWRVSKLMAIHLFISSHDEIKDFCSMDKKTGRRYGAIATSYKFINKKRTGIYRFICYTNLRAYFDEMHRKLNF